MDRGAREPAPDFGLALLAPFDLGHERGRVTAAGRSNADQVA
jgi:hypothetical protein